MTPKARVVCQTAAENNETSILRKFVNLPYRLSPQNHDCQHCGALHWGEERTKANISNGLEIYSNCCQQGSVTLPWGEFEGDTVPLELFKLYTEDNPVAREFQDNITHYNNALSFTSLGVKVDQSVAGQKGINTFRVSGQLAHCIGSSLPVGKKKPSYAQIYVVGDGAEAEADVRLGHFAKKKLDRGLMLSLQKMLHTVNPYVKFLKSSATVLQTNPLLTIMLKTLPPGKREIKTYNKPRPDDVAALVESSETLDDKPRHIILHRKNNKLKHITDLSTGYLPLRYPMMLPFGSQQWDDDYVSPSAGQNNKRKQEEFKVTNLEWGAYLLYERNRQFSPFLHGRRLTQQLIVDLYLCVERSRLRWYKNNQKTIKADMYQGLREAFDGSEGLTGRRIILPSTFGGGPRHMHKLYHDAMALVREFGSPSLFITMTANPNWPEIQENLRYGETAIDRPDLVARVFFLKLIRLLHEIYDLGRLGKCISYLGVVEFQKRGLPHAHILVILEESSRPKTADQIDTLVTAQIPVSDGEARLRNLVETFMLHGPCRPGGPCWVDGKCRSRFPKPFWEETSVSDASFPNYCRPDNGVCIKKGTFTYTNQHVVPYNKYLLLLMECHINVEIPVGTKPIRYLYKYVTKGYDKARVYMETAPDPNTMPVASTSTAVPSGTVSKKRKRGQTEKVVPAVHDETKEFQDCRYISAAECAWRLFKFFMNKRKPAVMNLHIHLEHEQLVYFEDEEQARRRVTIGPPPNSTLTGFFQLCQENAVGHGLTYARDILYVDVTKYFTWDKAKKKFKARNKDLRTVGRVHYVKVAEGEKYFLRLLLFNIRGPQSFRDLRTIDGTLYSTFREAAEKLGLLESDKHHQCALREASLWATSHQMRELFSLILTYGPVSAPDALWHEFYRFLTEDVERILTGLGHVGAVDERLRAAYGFKKLNDSLRNMGKGVADIGFSKSLVEEMENAPGLTRIPKEFTGVSAQQSRAEFEHEIETLNEEQKTFVDHVLENYRRNSQTMAYLDGPGGTGKTYTLNTILHFFEGEGLQPVAVSSSGVSALLLSGGTTAHSAFNIPITIDDTSTCDLNGRNEESRKILSAPLIIWDEISMQHKHCVEAVDRSLQHIKKNSKPFGGISIIFSGDFRQTLPIVPHGTLSDQKHACLKSSHLWSRVKNFKLKKNLRLRMNGDSTDTEAAEYAAWLLDLGNGKLQDRDRQNIILQHVNVHSVAPFTEYPTSLISWLYKDLHIPMSEPEAISTAAYFSERGLITPFNDTVSRVNESILKTIPGVAYCAISSDEPDANFADPMTPEILNNINFPGFPQHTLYLKVGQPVMVLRNLSIGSGLCNGTRLVIISVSDYILRAVVITGPKRGEIIGLPKMKLIHQGDLDQPIPFSRRQFPVVSAFCMTINKSQGQSLEKVGIFLPGPAFSHGQLYVALSRCTTLSNLRVSLATQVSTRTTTNIVCRELIND